MFSSTAGLCAGRPEPLVGFASLIPPSNDLLPVSVLSFLSNTLNDPSTEVAFSSSSNAFAVDFRLVKAFGNLRIMSC
jgi:hypothetical protein